MGDKVKADPIPSGSEDLSWVTIRFVALSMTLPTARGGQ